MTKIEAGCLVMNVKTFKLRVSRKLQVFKVRSLNSSGKAIVEVAAAPYSAVQCFDPSDLMVKDGDFWRPAPPVRRPASLQCSEGA
jgi:hypothetical protein